MSDITFDFYSVLLTNAQRLAWTPDPGAAPGPPGQFLLPVAVESDTGDAFYWDNTGTPQWRPWPGGAGGTVTHTGALTSGQLVFGNGTDDIAVGDLSGDVSTSGAGVTTIGANKVTTTTINNAAVTLAKIANAAANSKLLGSGAAGAGAAYTELTLGANLSMSGTTLNATGGGGTPGGSSGDIQYNNAGVFGGFTMSGDVTVVTSTGVATIANNAVTLAKLAPQADQTILGNVSGSSAVPSALTATQVSTMLSTTGSWTPGIAFGGAAVGVTYSLQFGHYVRVGNLVTASCHFTLTSKGTSTGNATITGLPFTTKNTANYSQAASVGIIFGSNVVVTAFADPNVTVIRMWNPTANVPITDGSISGSGELVVSLTYECEP